MAERKSARQKARLSTAMQMEVKPPRTLRGARQPRASPLTELPVELIYQIFRSLPPDALLALTLTSRSLRRELLDPTSLPLWKQARSTAGLSADLPSWSAAGVRGEVGLAALMWGKRCRACGRGNARKLDVRLRVRLCANCWKTEITPEGPDEPDPAFESYFTGTKRYTPRNATTGRRWRDHVAFFYAPSLQLTSEWLSSLFTPYLEALPPPEVDDDGDQWEHLIQHPPPPVVDALKAREEWLKQVRSDAAILSTWDAERKSRELEEHRRRRTGALGAAAAG